MGKIYDDYDACDKHIHDACLTPRAGDIKYVDRIEYAFDGGNWRATGKEVAGLTNTPRAGEIEGSRDRKPTAWDGLGEPPVGQRRLGAGDDGNVVEQEWRGKRLGWKRVRTQFHSASPAAARLETDSAKRKDVPLYSGVIRYFPDALAEVARLSKAGNDKHNPGEPLHWSRAKSDDHLDCLARHLAEAGTMDDDGFLHDVKIVWRALAGLQTRLERERGLPISPGSKS